MSHSQIQRKLFILRRAWLNLWDKRMTTGRINQIAIVLESKIYIDLQQHTHEERSLTSPHIYTDTQIKLWGFPWGKTHTTRSIAVLYNVFRQFFCHKTKENPRWPWELKCAMCSWITRSRQTSSEASLQLHQAQNTLWSKTQFDATLIVSAARLERRLRNRGLGAFRVRAFDA